MQIQSGVVDDLIQKCRINFRSGNYSNALSAANEIFANFSDILTPEHRIDLLQIVSSTYFVTGIYDLALEKFSECLELTRNCKRQEKEARALFNLSEIYLVKEQYPIALKHAVQSMELYKVVGDNINIRLCELRVSAIYIEKGQFETAKNILLKMSGFKDGEYAYGTLKVLLGRVEESIQNYRGAEDLYKEAITYFRTNSKRNLAINALLHLATLEFILKEYQVSLRDAKQALGEALEINDFYGQLSSYELEYQIHKEQQDYQSALSSYEKYKDLKQKQDKKELETRMEILNISYESSKKEQEAELYKLRSEQLERDLATKTIYLVNQTELLSRFRDDLRKVVRDGTTAEDVVRGVKIKLKELPCSTIDWEQYDEQFRSVHPHFRNNLLERFSDLSEIEVKICSLLRVSLTSNDIARLLCLSQRNIENHRYRIRKKLNLESDDNIHRFLETF